MKSLNPRTIPGAVVFGALNFAVVSLAGFAVWAFWGKWFYANLGETGLYAVSLGVFLLLAGFLLHPLIEGEQKMLRFYKAFLPAFVAYAVSWSLSWFALKFGVGEWLGSLAGSAVFAMVLGKILGARSRFLPVILVLFVAHSAGYFLGGFIYQRMAHPPIEFAGLGKSVVSLLGRLAWGLCYGLGFGSGIGFAFAVFQKAPVAAPPAAS